MDASSADAEDIPFAGKQRACYTVSRKEIIMLPIIILAIEDPVRRKAYEDAFEKYEQHLFGVARSILSGCSPDLAEDAVMEAFKDVIDKDGLPSDSPERVKAFMTIVTRRKAYDILRSQLHISTGELTEKDAFYSFSATGLELTDLIEKLPDIYKEVLLLNVSFGYSIKEIAQILQIKYYTAAKRLERARAILHELYNKD